MQNAVNIPISNTEPISGMEYTGSAIPTTLLQLDKIGATAHNFSIMCKDNLFDGNVVEIGNIIHSFTLTGGEVYEANQVKEDSDLIGIVSQGDIDYLDFIPSDSRYIEAGKIARVYVLSVGDVITITNSAILGQAPQEGSYITTNGYNLALATKKPNKGLILKCVGTDTLSNHKASTLVVINTGANSQIINNISQPTKQVDIGVLTDSDIDEAINNLSVDNI